MNVVLTFVPMISRTDDWISGSVNLLMWPLRTEIQEMKTEIMET